MVILVNADCRRRQVVHHLLFLHVRQEEQRGLAAVCRPLLNQPCDIWSGLFRVMECDGPESEIYLHGILAVNCGYGCLMVRQILMDQREHLRRDSFGGILLAETG